MKSNFLIIFLFLFSFTNCKSSKCSEKIMYSPLYTTPDGHPEVDHQVVCYNITSDFEVDINELKNVTYAREKMWFYDSDVPKLISNSSLSKLNYLHIFTLKNASVEEIEPGAFNTFDKLKILNLIGNRLKKISPGIFSGLKNLESLVITQNLISEIEDNSFSGLGNLKTLDLDQNELTSLRQGLFNDLKNLEELDVSDNPLVTFYPSDFTNLKHIGGILVHLRTLDFDFRDGKRKRIQFSFGDLEEVDLEKFSSFKRVILNDNKIRVVHNWNKSHSDLIELDTNQITVFDIPESVKELNLRFNQIETIGNTFLNKTKKIKELDLGENKISELRSESLLGLSQLQILKLDKNDLVILKENNFINTPNLYDLDISYNKIKTIEVGAFNGLDKLEQLDISNNDLKKLEPPVLSEIRRVELSADNTNIDWAYLKSIVKNGDDMLLKINPRNWICATLENTDSTEFWYLTKDDFEKVSCHLKDRSFV